MGSEERVASGDRAPDSRGRNRVGRAVHDDDWYHRRPASGLDGRRVPSHHRTPGREDEDADNNAMTMLIDQDMGPQKTSGKGTDATSTSG
jgi:hypothetical protein